MQLNDIAHAFPAGHRMRIALSTSYWPIAWPSPAAGGADACAPARARSICRCGRRAPEDDGCARSSRRSPRRASATRRLRELPLRRTIELDLATNETVYTFQSGEFGAALARIEPIEMDLGYTFLKRHRISEYDPLSAQTEIVQQHDHAAHRLVGADRMPHAV